MLGLQGRLTWMPLRDGTLTDSALLCAAQHFWRPAADIALSTVTTLGKTSPALLAFAAPFTGDQGQLRLVCVLLLRRQLRYWTSNRTVNEAIPWQDRESFAEDE